MKLNLPVWEPLLESKKGMFHVPAKKEVFRQGSPVSGIYFIYQGKVKVVSTGKSGSEQIIRLAAEGKILGHRGYSGGEEYSVSGIALEDTVVCFFDKDCFFKFLKMNNELTYQLLFFYAEELGHIDDRLRKMTELTIKQRLAEAIHDIAKAFGFEEDGKTVGHVMSRKDLAKMVGSVPDVVSRTLAELASDELIQLVGKKIVVPDQERLLGII